MSGNNDLVRALARTAANRCCVECGQRGVMYADMTTAAFVCTDCSGDLRGLPTPHRVKSISMATFSNEEVAQLKAGGNEACKKKYMSVVTDDFVAPNPKNRNDMRQFMTDKYEHRLFMAGSDRAASHQHQQPHRAAERKRDSPPQRQQRGHPGAFRDDDDDDEEDDWASLRSGRGAAAHRAPEVKPVEQLFGDNVPRLIVNAGGSPSASSSAPAQPQQPEANLLGDFGTVSAPAAPVVSAPPAQPAKPDPNLFLDFSKIGGRSPFESDINVPRVRTNSNTMAPPAPAAAAPTPTAGNDLLSVGLSMAPPAAAPAQPSALGSSNNSNNSNNSNQSGMDNLLGDMAGLSFGAPAPQQMPMFPPMGGAPAALSSGFGGDFGGGFGGPGFGGSSFGGSGPAFHQPPQPTSAGFDFFGGPPQTNQLQQPPLPSGFPGFGAPPGDGSSQAPAAASSSSSDPFNLLF